MSKKWFEKPMVISAIQHGYSDSYEILNNFTGPHFNTEQLFHVYAEGHIAYYNDENHGEKLREYLKISRKMGISQIVYVNVHAIEPENANLNWVFFNADGSPRLLYETHYSVCINEDYTNELIRNLKRLCTYDINGIFLDGPVVIGPCYCSHCKKLFYNTYNKDISTATSAEIMRFNIMKVNKFMKACHNAVKSVNPDVILYINNSALRADVTGSNTREIYDYVDFIGAEGGFVWTNRSISNWHVSPMAKLIETQAQGKPTVTFIAGDCKPWSYITHTPEETTIFYAQALANGSNVWYGLHCPIDRMQSKTGETAIKLNHFILDNPKVFSNHKPVSNVALLWGQDTANYYSSSVAKTDFTDNQSVGVNDTLKSNHSDSFHGCVEMLERSHVQFNIIDDVSILLGELKNYDLLIMPTVACLKEDVAKEVKKFTENGGNVISFYDTGFYSDDGTLLQTPLLKDIQGIKDVNSAIHYAVPGTGYQRVTAQNDYTINVSEFGFPSCNYAMNVTPSNDSKMFVETSEIIPSRYSAFPSKWYAGAIENNYGKGKSIYFTGDLGQAYFTSSNPDLYTLFVNTVNKLSRPIVETNAPGSVEVVLRKCEEGYALHLINFTGEMTHPITRIIDLYDTRVTLHLQDVKGELKSITGENPTNVEIKNGTISFTLPKIKIYEVIIIK